MMSLVAWLLLLLFSVTANISCEEQCLNKPCACCLTSNCDTNSTCENGCIDGYWGDKCYYTCPVHCVNCEQDRPYICGKCQNGYYNGYWHDINSNGPFDINSHGPWTENCINKCRPQCKSCFDYQHCENCVDGYYKTSAVQNCSLQCPQRCISCWTELDCTECNAGYFGRSCSQLCSKGCTTLSCDKKTGRCNCTSNYMGDTCQDSQANNNTLSIALGTVFGTMSVCLIALALLFGYRRKQKARIKRVDVSFQNTMSTSPESQQDISMISGNIDREISVYDEIPSCSTVTNVRAVQTGLDDTASQYSENGSGVHTIAVDTSFTSDNNDNGSEHEEKGSNYSFATDPINVKEKKVGNNLSSSGPKNDDKGEPDCNTEKISKENEAFKTEERAKGKQTSYNFNIEEDNESHEKGFKSEAEAETCEKDKGESFEKEDIDNGKRDIDEEIDIEDNQSFGKGKARKEKGLHPKDDYEELQKIKNNEHEYEEGGI